MMNMDNEIFHAEEDFRNTLATTTKDGKRIWLYPRIIKGFYYKRREIVSYALLIILFTLPWLEYKGNPIFMFNVVTRTFIVFGISFYPQDFYLLAIAIIASIMFVSLFTAIFGRIWCGWVCPQTLFMEMVFRRIENLIEGDYRKQKRLDSEDWNTSKIVKKTTKHLAFFMISFLISNIFLAYIIGKKALLSIVLENPLLHLPGLIAMIIFTIVFYFVFAKIRENVCTVICPYGRLQSSLVDKNTMVVAYDYQRGEPRGKNNQGDCIDCGICVHVCPTGIDIRNGIQMECIGCTACIDACDMVMEKVKKPKNLIGYNSINGIEKGLKFKLTTRVKAYTAVLLMILAVLTYLLYNRSDVDVTILRAPGQTFQYAANGNITNVYNYQILNKSTENTTLQLSTDGLKDASIKYVGEFGSFAKGELSTGTFIVEVPPQAIKANATAFKFQILKNGQVVKSVKSSFISPVN